MHPDLPKLLDVQDKDRRVAELRAQLDELATERGDLDSALDAARGQVAHAEKGAADAASRRDEREQKVEAQRALQDRRRERLEQERNPRVAAQLMADVDLGRGMLVQEESDWMRVAEEATARDAAVIAATEALAALEAEQAEVRADLDTRTAEVTTEFEAASTERDTAAGELDKTLRVRYTRLRGARKTEVLVLATGGTCTACYTAIPTSRLGQLQADCILIDGCEMCGAILYLPAVPA